MFYMDIIYEVRRRHVVQGQTVSTIAREMDLSRPTARKYLQVTEDLERLSTSESDCHFVRRSAVNHKSEGLQSNAWASFQTDVMLAALLPNSIPDKNDRAIPALSAKASWLIPTSTRLIFAAFPWAMAMVLVTQQLAQVQRRGVVKRLPGLVQQEGTGLRPALVLA